MRYCLGNKKMWSESASYRRDFTRVPKSVSCKVVTTFLKASVLLTELHHFYEVLVCMHTCCPIILCLLKSRNDENHDGEKIARELVNLLCEVQCSSEKTAGIYAWQSIFEWCCHESNQSLVPKPIHTQSIDEFIHSYSICMEGTNNCLELEIDGPVVFKCYKIISTLTASLHTAHFPHLSAVCLASNLVVVVVNQPPFSSWYIMGEVVLSQDRTTFFAKFEGNGLIVYKCSKLPNCLFHLR